MLPTDSAERLRKCALVQIIGGDGSDWIKKLARLLNKLPNTVSSFSGVEKTLLRVVGVCVDIIFLGALHSRWGLGEDPVESPDDCLHCWYDELLRGIPGSRIGE